MSRSLSDVVGDAPAFTFEAETTPRRFAFKSRTGDWHVASDETGPQVHGVYPDIETLEGDYLFYGPGPIHLDTVVPLHQREAGS